MARRPVSVHTIASPRDGSCARAHRRQCPSGGLRGRAGCKVRPLRVLYLIPDLGKGGAERFLIDLATVLRRRDDVDFVIGTLYERNLYGPLTHGLPVEQLHFQTFSLRGPNSCPGYTALLQRFRPDVVHTHLFLAEFLSSYSVSPDIAYICHGHDNMAQLRPPSYRVLPNRVALTNLAERRHLIRHKYNKVPTAFVANSNHTFAYYRRVLPRHMRKEVFFIPVGFDYHRFFNAATAPPADRERVRLINVGNFQDKKNQIFIVAIAAELQRRGFDFEFNLLGDGINRARVEAAVRAAGLGDRVFCRGNVDEVEEWMRTSHIYVHTATYEPFGLVLLEAMAAGLPCVTLDGMGNRDLIEEGQNGYLLERADAPAFVDRIVELATNRDEYRATSAYAQAFARRYDIADAANRLVDFYRTRVEFVRRRRQFGKTRPCQRLA
jgi:glycosyltransferase involved in cell wall biosynthesis